MALGGVLMVGIPLLTLLALRDSPNDAGQAALEKKPNLPMSLEELDERKEEFTRMYNDNSRLFLLRSRDADLAPEYRGQEVAWARQTLERCREGFTVLLSNAKAFRGTPEFRARIPEIENWLEKIEGDLRTLPQASPLAPPSSPISGPAPSSGPAR